MPMRKADIEIGYRAFDEVLAHFGTLETIKKRLGVSDTAIRQWRDLGCVPSVFYIAKMAEAGVDVVYILTGKRK